MTEKVYNLTCADCDDLQPTYPTMATAKIAISQHVKKHMKDEPDRHAFDILHAMMLWIDLKLNLLFAEDQEEE